MMSLLLSVPCKYYEYHKLVKYVLILERHIKVILQAIKVDVLSLQPQENAEFWNMLRISGLKLYKTFLVKNVVAIVWLAGFLKY